MPTTSAGVSDVADPDLSAAQTRFDQQRARVARQDEELLRLRAAQEKLAVRLRREQEVGDARAEATAAALAGAAERLADARAGRDRLLGEVADLSHELVTAFPPERWVAELDGTRPVAMLPVRLETRYASPTRLRVRIFPDQVHVDAHDPALTDDERAAGEWYWHQRYAAAPGEAEQQAARQAWEELTARFRPQRAAYVVHALTPLDPPGQGEPTFPETVSRPGTATRAPVARLLPERFCIVGLDRSDDGWTEVFRQWGDPVADDVPVGPALDRLAAPDDPDALPTDEGTRWLHDPQAARERGLLVEVEHPALARGVERLVVVGVDWTQPPEQGAVAVTRHLEAQRWGGHLGFVAQGTPTNHTADARSGFSSERGAEAALLDPTATPEAGDGWSAGTRLTRALGLAGTPLAGVPGSDLREHAWSSALCDVLWRVTGGYYVAEMLAPLELDTDGERGLRSLVAEHVFASGPLPTLRVGAQPYGVLPVVARRRFQPADETEELVHRVAGALARVVRRTPLTVPHLSRAGDDVEGTMLTLLQRTPVPWAFRHRPVTGPVLRKNVSQFWDAIAVFSDRWTAAILSALDVDVSLRLNELTLGKDHRLPVPLVHRSGDAEGAPPAYLAEIAGWMRTAEGRTALNLREDSEALLEAMAACSAVMEMDRTAVRTVRDRVLLIDPADVAASVALSTLSVPTPQTLRVEQEAALPLLDFRSHRQLADAVVPVVDAQRPLKQVVTTELDRQLALGTVWQVADPYYWLGRAQRGLLTLAEAPPDQVEWAFRGYLDLFSSRIDAWLTGLASSRLAAHREVAPEGVHVGCWGVVEQLRRDGPSTPESHGFVHAPSLSHAASTALLRNGRLANRTDRGEGFDLQLTSERVRRGRWLLEGVAEGQRLAALLGYRLERGLLELDPRLMRYQMPMRRVAPLRDLSRPVTEPVETLAARDVVDGVALIDRWREDREALVGEVLAQSPSAPAADRARLHQVIAAVADSYDAVSDLLVGESLHQAAVGNLERSGAALRAHDRHGSVRELDYVTSPRGGHTVGHRVLLVAQDDVLADGWPRDERGRAEPRLDAWVSRVLGPAAQWRVGAVLRSGGQDTVLPPVPVADLGLGPLSLVLAAQRPGDGGASELEQRVALHLAGGLPADPGASLDLLADDPDGVPGRGLAALVTLAGWLGSLVSRSALTAGDLLAADDVAAGVPVPGSVDVDDLAARAARARAGLVEVVQGLAQAGTVAATASALLRATAYAGGSAVPRVPATHPDAAAELAAQVAEELPRLQALSTAVDALLAEPVPADPVQAADHHVRVLRALLGDAQPVLPRWRLADPDPVASALAQRDRLLGGDPTGPAVWLQRSALVRLDLDPLAGLLLHLEADGADVAEDLQVVQRPLVPDQPWVALPQPAGPPPHGAVGLVLHAWDPVDPAQPLSGVVVDAWNETLPAQEETTAVGFHYDAPGARAPQSLLLAVHPAPPGAAQPRWSLELLLDTVNDAVDLAQLRTVSAKELAPMETVLPALYLPDNYTRDVPSVPIAHLVSELRAKQLGTLVMGKD